MRRPPARVAALLVSLLAACGGGGGDAPDPQPPIEPAAQYPIEAAFRSVLLADRTFTATYTPAGGPTFTLTQRFLPTADGAINGVPHKTSFVTTAIASPGNVDTTWVKYLFLESPLQLGGHVEYVNPTQPSLGVVYTQDGPIPASAAAGANGPLVRYTTNGQVGTVAWSLTAQTSATAWFCLHITRTSAEDHCYLVDTAGNVSAARYSAVVAGQTVTFR